MALPLLFSSSTRVVGAAVDVVVVAVVGERWYSSIFLCLAWLPYSYSTHTTRQHSLRSALAVCDQSLRMARKRMRTSKRRMNRMAYAASVRCSAGIYFILLYSNVKYKCVCVWSAYTTSLDECVCVCVLTLRCCFLSTSLSSVCSLTQSAP